MKYLSKIKNISSFPKDISKTSLSILRLSTGHNIYLKRCDVR